MARCACTMHNFFVHNLHVHNLHMHIATAWFMQLRYAIVIAYTM